MRTSALHTIRDNRQAGRLCLLIAALYLIAGGCYASLVYVSMGWHHIAWDSPYTYAVLCVMYAPSLICAGMCIWYVYSAYAYAVYEDELRAARASWSTPSGLR